MRLLGRRAEFEFLEAVLADALAGRSRVVVPSREAGAGKSALLDFVTDRGTGYHVATAVGIESEMELAYSGQRYRQPRMTVMSGMSADGPAPNNYINGYALGVAWLEFLPDSFLELQPPLAESLG